MAVALMRKAALLEDQNLLMLMSMPYVDSNAKEYLRTPKTDGVEEAPQVSGRGRGP